MKKLVVTQDDRTELKKLFTKFHSSKRKEKEEVFYDLCFAICAPQMAFSGNLKVIEKLRQADFYNKDIPSDEMYKIMRPTRFFIQKTKNLLKAKEDFENTIFPTIYAYNNPDKYLHHESEQAVRDFLVKYIRGLGMKSSSHFLRNQGMMNLAILDVHILKFMGLNRESISGINKYKEVEQKFISQAKKYKLKPAELDAIIWKRYSGTEWHEFAY